MRQIVRSVTSSRNGNGAVCARTAAAIPMSQNMDLILEGETCLWVVWRLISRIDTIPQVMHAHPQQPNRPPSSFGPVEECDRAAADDRFVARGCLTVAARDRGEVVVAHL